MLKKKCSTLLAIREMQTPLCTSLWVDAMRYHYSPIRMTVITPKTGEDEGNQDHSDNTDGNVKQPLWKRM